VIEEQFHPAGYNIGFNVGEMAGQTVMHCHCHIIPRYAGDVRDPRGGVRGVVPYKHERIKKKQPNEGFEIATSVMD